MATPGTLHRSGLPAVLVVIVGLCTGIAHGQWQGNSSGYTKWPPRDEAPATRQPEAPVYRGQAPQYRRDTSPGANNPWALPQQSFGGGAPGARPWGEVPHRIEAPAPPAPTAPSPYWERKEYHEAPNYYYGPGGYHDRYSQNGGMYPGYGYGTGYPGGGGWGSPYYGTGGWPGGAGWGSPYYGTGGWPGGAGWGVPFMDSFGGGGLPWGGGWPGAMPWF